MEGFIALWNQPWSVTKNANWESERATGLIRCNIQGLQASAKLGQSFSCDVVISAGKSL